MEGNPGLNGRIEADRGVSGGARFSAEGRKVTMGVGAGTRALRVSVREEEKKQRLGARGSCSAGLH